MKDTLDMLRPLLKAIGDNEPDDVIMQRYFEVQRHIRHMEAELEFVVQQRAYLRTKIAAAEKELTK